MTLLVYCKRCQKRTEYLHLKARTCICSTCGETNYAPKAPKMKGKRGRRALLTIEQVDEVVRLRLAGIKDKEIATRFGVSTGTIYNARKAREKDNG
jgi:predicted DNA-binding protein (UPF0251 family)